MEAEVCTQCGERYFYAKTLDANDKLLESDHEVSERMNVEVVANEIKPGSDLCRQARTCFSKPLLGSTFTLW